MPRKMALILEPYNSSMYQILPYLSREDLQECLKWGQWICPEGELPVRLGIKWGEGSPPQSHATHAVLDSVQTSAPWRLQESGWCGCLIPTREYSYWICHAGEAPVTFTVKWVDDPHPKYVQLSY